MSSGVYYAGQLWAVRCEALKCGEAVLESRQRTHLVVEKSMSFETLTRRSLLVVCSVHTAHCSLWTLNDTFDSLRVGYALPELVKHKCMRCFPPLSAFSSEGSTSVSLSGKRECRCPLLVIRE